MPVNDLQTEDPKKNDQPLLDEFYRSILNSEKDLGRIVITIVSVIICAYILRDLFIDSTLPNIFTMQMIRSVFVISSIIILILIKSIKDYSYLYLLMALWVVLYFINKLSANVLLNQNLTSYLFFDSIIILTVYVVIPLKKLQKVTLTAVFTIVDLSLVVIYRDIISLNLFNIFFVFLATYGVGYFSYRTRFKHQFNAFLTNIENSQLLKQTRDQLEQIKQLSGLIPICASCKKVRDDSGYWNKVEEYLGQHTQMKFTHSVCPDCKDDMLVEFHKHV